MTEEKHQRKAKQSLTEDSDVQESTVRLFNKEVKRSDLFKFLGLIGFFASSSWSRCFRCSRTSSNQVASIA